jgi:hypothetical protein
MHWTPHTFVAQVIRPALRQIHLYSAAAEQLLLGTAIQESRLKYVVQQPHGPARGYFQMEPGTHDDIWKSFLHYHKHLAARVNSLLSKAESPHKFAALKTNHKYAAAMCRVHYFRVSTALPHLNDIQAMAEYWKTYYNSEEGGGTVDEYVLNWNRFTAPAQHKN